MDWFGGGCTEKGIQTVKRALVLNASSTKFVVCSGTYRLRPRREMTSSGNRIKHKLSFDVCGWKGKRIRWVISVYGLSLQKAALRQIGKAR